MFRFHLHQVSILDLPAYNCTRLGLSQFSSGLKIGSRAEIFHGPTSRVGPELIQPLSTNTRPFTLTSTTVYKFANPNYSNQSSRVAFCCLGEKLAGLLKLGFSNPLCQNRGFVDLSTTRGFGGIFSRQMAWNLERCNLGLKLKAGVVLPATETHVEEAIGAIKSGKVIAVPTDTLYGFACDACSKEAVHRIYEIKGRKQTSPLAICVADVSDIERFAVTDNLPHGLLDSLLPGPVTVVLKRGECSILEKSLNPGLDSIGVRVPDSNFIRIIARGSGSALALTSANLSGQPSSINIKDFENLWQHCAYVYDGGLLPSGRAGSTVIDLTKPGMYKILRPGSAMEETIAILERFFLKKDP